MFEIFYPLTPTDGKYQLNYNEENYIKHILHAKFLSLHYEDY